jgi:1-deoxyxylulose-5-phosphate synthase
MSIHSQRRALNAHFCCRVRCLGALRPFTPGSSPKLQHAAGLGGWTRFVAMQNQYSLLRREEERELLPMCADMGVGVVPYSPQGNGPGRARVGAQQSGRLRPYRRSDPTASPTEAVAALDLHLADDETRALEEPYTPYGPAWF